MSNGTADASGQSWKFSLLFGAVLALTAANIFLYLQLDETRADLAEQKEALLVEVGRVRKTSDAASAEQVRRIETLKGELEQARRQAADAVGDAKDDAVARAEELAKKLSQEQKQIASQLTQQVEKVRSDASTQMAAVDGRVASVKGDVEKTRAELEQTVSDLKRVRGDMGEMSGLIATNRTELSALRQLGERDYVEFNIRKSKNPTRVGTVAVRLTKADVKRGKYNIELYADDRKVEKKDKNVNEPVQFYMSSSKIPYEIVVNQVNKDQIVGYLAIPKVKTARGESGG